MSRHLLLIICKYNINTVKRHHQLENWAPHQTVSHWTKALNGYACNMKWNKIVAFLMLILPWYCWVEEGGRELWSTRMMMVMMSLWWVGCNRTGQGCLEGSSPLLHRHPRTYQRPSFFVLHLDNDVIIIIASDLPSSLHFRQYCHLILWLTDIDVQQGLNKTNNNKDRWFSIHEW